MPLPVSTNPISLQDIQNEFGGSNPISISEYYAGGGLVASGTVGFPSGSQTGIPASGAISLSNFHGASATENLGFTGIAINLPGFFDLSVAQSPSGAYIIASSDSSQTWTNRTTNNFASFTSTLVTPTTNHGRGQIQYGNNRWLLNTNNQRSWVSADDGLTWTGPATNLTAEPAIKPGFNGTTMIWAGNDAFQTYYVGTYDTTTGLLFVRNANLRIAGWENYMSVTVAANRGSQFLLAGGDIFGVPWTALSNDRGVTWTWTDNLGNTLFTSFPSGAAWSPALNLWVIVGSDGVCVTSTDGSNWTYQPNYSASSGGNMQVGGPHRVVWSPALGKFVAVAGQGQCATSIDGINWREEITLNAVGGGGMTTFVEDVIVNNAGKIVVLAPNRIAISA
jgi:hypothetical protein